MKFLVVLSALVAFAAAKPQIISPYGLPLAYSGLGYTSLGYSAINPYAYSSVLAAPAAVAAPAVVAAPAGVKSQYHSQDELGQASYGHAEPLQSHTAVQDAFGNKIGSFSYVAPNGQVLRTDYVADGAGYRVASNALPVGPGAGPAPVVDTPEVVAARAAHLAVHARAKRGVVALGHTPAATAPLAYAAPLAYHAPLAAAPLAHAYAAHAYAAPLAYSAPIAHAPLAYAAPAAVAAPLLSREATLTTVVNNPGHAVSYRVD